MFKKNNSNIDETFNILAVENQPTAFIYVEPANSFKASGDYVVFGAYLSNPARLNGALRKSDLDISYESSTEKAPVIVKLTTGSDIAEEIADSLSEFEDVKIALSGTFDQRQDNNGGNQLVITAQFGAFLAFSDNAGSSTRIISEQTTESEIQKERTNEQQRAEAASEPVRQHTEEADLPTAGKSFGGFDNINLDDFDF